LAAKKRKKRKYTPEVFDQHYTDLGVSIRGLKIRSSETQSFSHKEAQKAQGENQLRIDRFCASCAFLPFRQAQGPE
jgi:hypothetical protein